MTITSRPTLGDYMSLVCFQYLRTGTEEVADRAPIVAAGRQRGFDVVGELGLAGFSTDGATIQKKLDEVLGLNGTRLCLIKNITEKPNGGYEVHVTETACTANKHSDTPVCTFTMGVFIGALHGITGNRMRGTEVQCEACGADECVYQIDPV